MSGQFPESWPESSLNVKESRLVTDSMSTTREATGEPRPPLSDRIALHVLEDPERHDPPTPHCDYCWEDWPCTVYELAAIAHLRQGEPT